ncbi:MAG: hypothetical protein J6Y82_09635 [Bacteroidales bacterium]|nr:hypothetical protein [Bacteroidales bacterium]
MEKLNYEQMEKSKGGMSVNEIQLACYLAMGVQITMAFSGPTGFLTASALNAMPFIGYCPLQTNG